MGVLEQAKGIQRQAASSATVVIRLALLEDLIAEIERLEAALVSATGKPHPLVERAAFKEAK